MSAPMPAGSATHSAAKKQAKPPRIRFLIRARLHIIGARVVLLSKYSPYYRQQTANTCVFVPLVLPPRLNSPLQCRALVTSLQKILTQVAVSKMRPRMYCGGHHQGYSCESTGTYAHSTAVFGHTATCCRRRPRPSGQRDVPPGAVRPWFMPNLHGQGCNHFRTIYRMKCGASMKPTGQKAQCASRWRMWESAPRGSESQPPSMLYCLFQAARGGAVR